MRDENDLDLSAFECEPAGDPLDSSSELEAMPNPDFINRVLTEVAETSEKEPMYRKGTYTDPLPRMTDPRRMIDFINTTRRLPIEKIEERVVNETMPVMLWKLREFALKGEYTNCRAVDIWLTWAQKIMSRPKRAAKDKSVASGALFDARLTRGDVIDVVPEKKKPAPFSKAGTFIGREKQPPKEKK